MKITGKINARAILDDVIGTGPTFYPALRQAMENAIDAGATSIRIEVVDRGKPDGYICIVDDGDGFKSEDFEAFCSLRLSSKTDKQGKIGKHGSGRLFLLRFAKRLTVYTRSKDFPRLSTFSFCYADLVDLLQQSTLSFERKEVRKPPWLPLETKTGTVLVIEDVNWKKVPTIREMTARFADYLKPSIARSVTVNGNSLMPREVVGDIIQESIKVDYLPGCQEIELFIPRDRRRGEEVILGAYNQICGIGVFCRQLKPMDLDLVPSVFQDRSVCGAIYIPALNEFRASSSEELEADFYGPRGAELRRNVLLFMQKEIQPLINAAFLRKKQRDDSAEQAAFLDNIVGRINPAFDFDPNAVRGGSGKSSQRNPKPGGSGSSRSGLQVNTRYITLTPGDQFAFYITQKANTSGRFSWDFSRSGGKILPKTGQQVIYTAGKKLSPEGEPFELVVWDTKARDLTVTIYIHIAKEMPVSISPQHVQVLQGASRKFRLRNATETSGNIHWRVKGRRPGTSLTSDTGSSTELVVEEKAPLGAYVLLAEDLDTQVVYEATFEVTEASVKDGAFIRIEDMYYLIEPAAHIQMVVERVKHGSSIVQKGRRKPVDVLRIGFNHPILRAFRKTLPKGERALSEAYVQKVLYYVFMAHLRGCEDDSGESLDGHSITQRLIQLETALIEARKG